MALTLLYVLAVTALDAALLALALGGIGPLSAHRRALALLAVWLVGGAVLALRRPVRVHDPAHVEREPRWMFPALGLLPLATPPIAAWGERMGWASLPGGPALRWAGVALSGAGLALRIAAMLRLGSRFSPLLATQRAHALETRGLYGVVRHPGYLGSLLVALGAVLAFGSALGLLPWALLLAALAYRVRREDALLESAFGEEFRQWRKRTGALVPRLRAR